MDEQRSAVIDPHLFNAGSVAIVQWNVTPQAYYQGPVSYISDNASELLGRDAQLLRDSAFAFLDLIHPDEHSQVTSELTQAIELGLSHCQHQDYRVLHPDGSEHWLMQLTMIQRQKGEVTGFLAYLIDVSARKRNELQLVESEQRYRQLFEGSRVVEYLLDPESGQIIDANQAACLFYGYSLEQLQQMHISQINILTPEEIAAAMMEAERNQRRHFIFRHQLANGQVRDVEVHSGPINFQGRELLYSIVHDITDRLDAERKLERLSQALDQSGSIVMITDASHHIEYVNQRFIKVTGFTERDVKGQHVDFLSAGRTSHDVRKKLSHTLRKGENWHGELLCRRKNGELYWSSMSVSPVFNDEGEVSSVVAVAEDLTEQRETDRKIQQLAFYDPTTGLGNRQFLLEAMDEYFTQSQLHPSRYHGKTALIYIDLDDFKRINDSLGHDMGDRLIKTAAHRLKVIVSDHDVLVRLGGDEFAILKQFESELSMEHWLDQLVQQFSRTVKLGPHTVSVFASIGIALLPQDAPDTSTGLRNAELAMYRAKKEHGCGYHFFSEELNKQAVERLHYEVKLRNALNNQELELHYQPKVNLSDGGVIGVEALIRWNDPERGLIPPGEFIPVAEETGLILPMSHWVLEQACYQVVQWQQDEVMRHLRMAVNLSARQFQDPMFVENVESILNNTGVNPALIELEITESMLMENMNSVLPMMQRLKDLGLSLAIDDFGTGYSSLAYLKQMPIDVLKVDRAFVRDLPMDENDCAITRAVILMAQQLGLKVVAEGIEESDQADFLTDSGCELGQGFLYSRPLKLTDLERVLHSSDPELAVLNILQEES